MVERLIPRQGAFIEGIEEQIVTEDRFNQASRYGNRLIFEVSCDEDGRIIDMVVMERLFFDILQRAHKVWGNSKTLDDIFSNAKATLWSP